MLLNLNDVSQMVQLATAKHREIEKAVEEYAGKKDRDDAIKAILDANASILLLLAAVFVAINTDRTERAKERPAIIKPFMG